MQYEHDLAEKKQRLSSIEAEIAAQTRTFEESIAELRREHARARREYAEALRTELSRLDDGSEQRRRPAVRTGRGTAPRPSADSIVAALERAQMPVSVERIRQLADIPSEVSPASLSTMLRRLVDEGRVVREGQRRGTKYRIP